MPSISLTSSPVEIKVHLNRRGRLRLLQCGFVRSRSPSSLSNAPSHVTYSGWDLHDTVYTKELLISNRANGYRDLLARVDLSTYRRIPWEGNIPFFLVSFLDPDTREPIPPCPRGTLSKAIKAASDLGWKCLSGVEYEVCWLPLIHRHFD